jgi:hypothetical protein
MNRLTKTSSALVRAKGWKACRNKPRSRVSPAEPSHDDVPTGWYIAFEYQCSHAPIETLGFEGLWTKPEIEDANPQRVSSGRIYPPALATKSGAYRMPRWCRASPSEGDSSWLLAPPATTFALILGIVWLFSTPPSAHGEKMSQETL